MYCLAIDIGASSGRHILGEYKDGRLNMTEVYRFDNGFVNQSGTLAWDTEYLFKSVVEGIKKCAEAGKIPQTVAIDTWGVDYVLLDKDQREIFPAVSYRDARTLGVPDEVDKIISADKLYEITGIQRQSYNTIYQLCCDVKSGKMDKAEHLLMMPEYLSYKLTGNMKSEYTIASTTSLVNAQTKKWDMELINKLGIKSAIFKEICMPGSEVGHFTKEVQDYVGFDATVLFAPCHDTASAVAACDLEENDMYVSSGTWSLVGVVNTTPVLTKEAREANFANEGGVKGTYRFLKNIMGMWLFQSIRRNLDKKYTYDEMMQMAQNSSFTKTFNPNDERLLSPENMIEAIRECLGDMELPVEDVISSVYHSLAESYRLVVGDIERLSGKTIKAIHIIGGGSKDAYLNSLIAEYTKKNVVKGVVEATAMGNLKTQLESRGIPVKA